MSVFIVFSMARLIMNGTVNFDDEFNFCAVEVYDKAAYRMLSTESQTAKPFLSQALPKQVFRRSEILAHFARAFLDVPVNCAVPV